MSKKAKHREEDVDDVLASLSIVSALMAAIGILVKDLDQAGVISRSEFCEKIRVIAKAYAAQPKLVDEGSALCALADAIERDYVEPRVGNA